MHILFLPISVTDMLIYNRYHLHLLNRVGGAQTYLKFVICNENMWVMNLYNYYTTLPLTLQIEKEPNSKVPHPLFQWNRRPFTKTIDNCMGSQ